MISSCGHCEPKLTTEGRLSQTEQSAKSAPLAISCKNERIKITCVPRNTACMSESGENTLLAIGAKGVLGAKNRSEHCLAKRRVWNAWQGRNPSFCRGRCRFCQMGR